MVLSWGRELLKSFRLLSECSDSWQFIDRYLLLEQHGASGFVLVWPREVLSGLHHVAEKVTSTRLDDFEIRRLVEERVELRDCVALDTPVI